MSVFNLVYTLVSEIGRNVANRAKLCDSKRRLDGQVVVITGANTGIGKETAHQLALRGAKVIMACRSLEKGKQALDDILATNEHANVTLAKLDLASLKSVREFAQTMMQLYDHVDMLINNAGVMNTPDGTTTDDGFEAQIGTNHFGHFLLTMLLLPMLKKSPAARIINVSSVVHMAGKINLDNINLRNGAYSKTKGFLQSKLANVLFTRELARRLGPNSTVNTYSLHPGVHIVGDPQAAKAMERRILLGPAVAAQTILYCALEPSLDNESGFYYANCQRVDHMVGQATDDKTGQALWDLSCELVNLEPHFRLPAVKANAW